MVQGLAEIVIWTRHMDASFAFYNGIFGLELISPTDFRTRFLSTGVGPSGVPAMVVLFPHPEEAEPFPTSKAQRVLHHLALAVAPGQYDNLQQRCRDHGLEIREGIHPVLKGVRTFYVDDPEGNEVEIIAKGTST